MKNISPAFLSRFDIIYLENQLENINNDYKDLVDKIFLRLKHLEKDERKRKKDMENKSNTNDLIEFDEVNKSKNIDYSVSENLKSLVIDKIKILKDSQNDLMNGLPGNDVSNEEMEKANKNLTKNKYYPYYSFSYISKFCFSVYKLLLKFRDKLIKEINEEDIVSVVFDLIFLKEPKQIQISKYPSINKFISDINENIKKSKEIEERYSFESSEKLKNFVGIVYLSSLINLYLCVESPPGYGKTTAARAIAEMREVDENLDKKFYIQTFHSSSYPSDLYGTSTINNNQIVFNKGPLTRALIEGKFYIADELNISPISTILSIAPILDLIFDTRIFIPGMASYDKEFRISSTFFLIICQNNVGIIGRSELPQTLMKKIRKLNYPILEDNEIEKICNDIDEFLSKDNMIGKKESKQLGQCMIKINKEEEFKEQPWSLRDVTKLIKRLQYQKGKKNTFLNFQLQHNILFYALSRYSIDGKKKYLDKFCDILKKIEILNLDDNKINDLKETFKSETKLIEEENDEKITFLLKKKELIIVLYQEKKTDKNKNEIQKKNKNIEI